MDTQWRTTQQNATQTKASAWIGALACISALLLGGAHLVVNTIGFFAADTLGAADYALYIGYVIGVSAFCVALGSAALALFQPWGRRFSRRSLRIFVWIGCVLITLLAVMTLTQAIAARDLSRLTFAGPGAWASACGPLLGLAAWRSGHAA